jgi:hypothetical protein
MQERTGIDPMQIIQIRRKPQSFNRAVDISLDVLGRIGHLSIAEAVEAAFRCHYLSWSVVCVAT